MIQCDAPRRGERAKANQTVMRCHLQLLKPTQVWCGIVPQGPHPYETVNTPPLPLCHQHLHNQRDGQKEETRGIEAQISLYIHASIQLHIIWGVAV